jgi:hypothetical protein
MQRPSGVGAFQFVILASLRAVQLQRGCTPRSEGVHKHTVMAQLEVSQGKVIQALADPLLPVVLDSAAISELVELEPAY